MKQIKASEVSQARFNVLGSFRCLSLGRRDETLSIKLRRASSTANFLFFVSAPSSPTFNPILFHSRTLRKIYKARKKSGEKTSENRRGEVDDDEWSRKKGKVFFIRNYDAENRTRFSNLIIVIRISLRPTDACEKSDERQVKIY